MTPFPRELVAEALDLVPRVGEDDPIAPALADWHRRASDAYHRATGAELCAFCELDPAICDEAGVCQLRRDDDDSRSESMMLHGTE